jgi:hypothetical protein
MDTDFKERISNLSDAELLEMLGRNASDYRQEALDYAAEVLESRGVQTPKGSGPLPDANGALPSTVSKQVSALMDRYDDAYLLAGAVNGYGIFIKAIGVVATILLLLIGIRMFADSAIGLGLMVIGMLVGTLFYLIGVIVSAMGQIIKGVMDSAVNTSPLLTNEDRAKIMSLPKA